MKIAQIAPLIESVPSRLYGGSERIVFWLTEELVRQGHEVTLFASGDSITSAELVPCTQEALRLNPSVKDPIPYYMLMLDKVRRRVAEFDVLHFHIDHLHSPLFRDMAARTVTTLHGRQDLPDLPPLYFGFSEMPMVSISHAQREPLPQANFVSTVYHGLPTALHPPTFQPCGGYVAFLGRISPEKRPDRTLPMSYHNGSVLPHDNALIALGLAKCGLKRELERVFRGLFDAATYMDLRRLPELFCGFQRRRGRGPTLYPVVCAPQAWASAAPFTLIQASLGLEFDPEANEIRLRNPQLPAFLDEVSLRGLRLGTSCIDLIVRRHDGDVALQVLPKEGSIRVSAVYT